jgi:hypothetical protein
MYMLQMMENQHNDLVVILAGYKDRMETFHLSPALMYSSEALIRIKKLYLLILKPHGFLHVCPF